VALEKIHFSLAILGDEQEIVPKYQHLQVKQVGLILIHDMSPLELVGSI